jgi:hypothetical protein
MSIAHDHTRRLVWLVWLMVFCLSAISQAAGPPPLGFIPFTGNFSENFNTLPATGTNGTTQSSLSALANNGWYLGLTNRNFNNSGALAKSGIYSSSFSVTNPQTVTFSTGSQAGSTTNPPGQAFQWGIAGTNTVSDRAIGLAITSADGAIEARFANQTSEVIRSLNIKYDGEQWRQSGTQVPSSPAAANDRLRFAFSYDGLNYTPVSSLDFIAPKNLVTTAAALDGNATANRVSNITTTLTGLKIQPNQNFYLRWYDQNQSGTEQGKAIDNVSVQATKLGALPAFNNQLVARGYGQAAGLPTGVSYGSAFSFQLNQAGQVLLFSSINGPGITTSSQHGIFVGTPGNMQLALQSGGVYPGATADDRFVKFEGPILFSDQGEIGFRAEIEANYGAHLRRYTAWYGAPNQLRLITEAGGPVPGIPNTTFYLSTFGNAQAPLRAVTPNGALLIPGDLVGPTITADNDTAFWYGKPNNLQLVLRKGDPAPGTPAGVTFGYSSGTSFPFSQMVINPQGRLAFLSSIVGPGVTTSNEQGIWSGLPGALQLIAREGNPAVGAAAGVVYDRLEQRPMINRLGQVSFAGFMSGTGVTTANSQGLWLAQPNGTTQLVVRNGSAAPGLPAGYTMTGIYGSGSASGFTAYLSDQGQLAFVADVTGPDIPQNTGSSPTALFLGSPGNIKAIALTGTQIMDAEPGFVFHSFATDELTMNATGLLVFRAVAIRNQSESYAALYVYDGENIHQIARTGVQVETGLNIMETITDLSLRSLDRNYGHSEGYGSTFNDNGQLLYEATFSSSGTAIFLVTIPEPSSWLVLIGVLGCCLLIRHGICRA